MIFTPARRAPSSNLREFSTKVSRIGGGRETIMSFCKSHMSKTVLPASTMLLNYVCNYLLHTWGLNCTRPHQPWAGPSSGVSFFGLWHNEQCRRNSTSEARSVTTHVDYYARTIRCKSCNSFRHAVVGTSSFGESLYEIGPPIGALLIIKISAHCSEPK